MAEEKKGFFKRLVSGLTKTRDNIVAGFDSIFSGFSSIDDDFYEELEDIPNWRWVWQNKMLPLCKTVWEEYQFPSAHRRAAVSYNMLGDISQAEGNLQAARKYYELEIGIFKQLAEEYPTMQTRRSLSISYNRLGDILKAEGNIEAARKYYERDLEISKQLAEKVPSPEAWDDLAVSYYKLGILGNSVSSLQKALDIWTRLSEQYPMVAYYAQNRDFARSLLARGEN